jgi:hypothetical protein
MRKCSHAQHGGGGLPLRASAAPSMPQVAAPPRTGAQPRWHGSGNGRICQHRALALNAIAAAGALWLLLAAAYAATRGWSGGASRGSSKAPPAAQGHGWAPPYAREPLLISYSYFEKDEIQVSWGQRVWWLVGLTFEPRHSY